MKRILLSLMALVALVLITNTALAQGKYAPVKGASYEYSVSPLDNGDTYTFSVNQSTSTAGSTVGATISPTGSQTVAGGGTSSHTITWTSTGTYNLWIEVAKASSECTSYNRRYKPVTVTENEFDAHIYAIGTNVSDTYSGWETAGSASSDCFTFSEGYNFDVSGTPSDGSSYVFFVAETFAVNSSSNTWNISSLSITGTGVSNVVYWTGSAWAAISTPMDDLASDEQILLRATVANDPAGVTDIQGSITATENEGTDPLDDSNTANDTFDFEINAYPDLDVIDFN